MSYNVIETVPSNAEGVGNMSKSTSLESTERESLNEGRERYILLGPSSFRLVPNVLNLVVMHPRHLKMDVRTCWGDVLSGGYDERVSKAANRGWDEERWVRGRIEFG